MIGRVSFAHHISCINWDCFLKESYSKCFQSHSYSKQSHNIYHKNTFSHVKTYCRVVNGSILLTQQFLYIIPAKILYVLTFIMWKKPPSFLDGPNVFTRIAFLILIPSFYKRNWYAWCVIQYLRVSETSSWHPQRLCLKISNMIDMKNQKLLKRNYYI